MQQEDRLNDHIHIIRVAGLLTPEMDDNFGSALRDSIQPTSYRTITPTPPFAILEDPEKCDARAVTEIRNVIADIQARFGEIGKIIVIGCSNGGAVAFRSAATMRFENMDHVISIEAPLNPDVNVQPPRLIPPLALCKKHYGKRATLMRKALSQLSGKDHSKILIIQGGREDAIVPLDAQILPNIPAVQLPYHLGGVSDGLKKMLPPEYVTHLFWSRSKIDTVIAIIRTFIVEKAAFMAA